MSFKRAELRRKAKNAESANKSVCFKSMDEYKKVIQMNAERMAHQMFIDNADFAYKLNYRMMEIAVQIAYRSVTSHVGTKRMNRFMDHVYKNFKEISNVFTHDSDAEIGRWCEINNVDAEYFFGIKKKYIDPFPVRDEDGRPVIYFGGGRMMNNDKYRWHDLRKNPKDLPEKWSDVLLHTMRSEDIVAYHDSDFWYTSYDSLLICEAVSYYAIAWKYIEPFKEVEE